MSSSSIISNQFVRIGTRFFSVPSLNSSSKLLLIQRTAATTTTVTTKKIQPYFDIFQQQQQQRQQQYLIRTLVSVTNPLLERQTMNVPTMGDSITEVRTRSIPRNTNKML